MTEKFLNAAESALDKGCKATASATLLAAGCTIAEMPQGRERDVLTARHEQLHKQIYGRHELPLD